LTERLLRKPEPLREDLARYIADNLDEIEDEMLLVDDTVSHELKNELSTREAAAIANPREGSSWAEVKDRILNSSTK
jgi:hypothetical protein